MGVLHYSYHISINLKLFQNKNNKKAIDDSMAAERGPTHSPSVHILWSLYATLILCKYSGKNS